MTESNAETIGLLDPMVADAVSRLARTPRLLVASDYDGTLAPIVDDPAAAVPIRDAIVALRLLAELPGTNVAVISGRSLADLSRLTGFDGGGGAVHLVGSHGSEFDRGMATALTSEEQALRERVLNSVSAIAADHPGTHVERKPASIALHYRRAEPAVGEAAAAAMLDGPAKLDGVQIKQGKMVVELSVVATDKGSALETIRRRVGADAAIFVGDDVTDEDAFAVLRGPDVGVKVGPGPTSAGLRIDDPLVVARLLAALAEERSAHVSGAGVVPIERHALLSDQRTVALVTPSARITWACAPRIDSAAIFAALLDGPGAGYFDGTPLDDAGAPIETDGEQRYDGDSLVLVTDFGSCRVTDFLDTTGGRVTHRAGRTDLVRHIEGRGRGRVTFAPRRDYSRTPTALVGRAYGVEVLDSPDPIVLHATCAEWEVLDDGIHQTAVAEIDLDAHPGGVGLLLRFGSAATRPIASCDERAVVARSGTARMWQRWADDLRIPEGIADGDRPMVMRSALTLKALVYGPTGAIAAAATTSLPETIGGVRNWDYRFCWPRDAAIAATALVKLGSIG